MRTCCWEKRFEAELKRIEPNSKRADNLICGIDWVLARDPEQGINVDASPVWYIVSRDIPKARNLVIYYTFSAETVYFLSVTESPITMA
jgi:hypothetical protein